MGAVAAALVATPALAAPGPDAELVALGRKAAPLLREFDLMSAAWWAASKDDAAEIDRVGATIERITESLVLVRDRAMRIRATSLAGFQVKASLLRHEMVVNSRTEDGLSFQSHSEELAFQLLTELQAGGAA